MTIFKLTSVSIKMFVRNKQAVFFTFFTPLLIIVIFGAIGFNTTPKINVGYVVQGNLTPSTELHLNELRNISVFNVSYGTEQEERMALDNGNRSIVIITDNKNSRAITVLQNAGDSQALIAISILNHIFDTATIQAAHLQPLVSVNTQEINVHNLKYIDFLLPGLVALAVMQLAVFSVAFVFVEYKEKGILKRMLATPVHPYQFVTANIITRLIIAVIQAGFFIAVGIIFFGVHIIGSYWLILLTVILGAILFLGLGFTVSGISKTTESVPALANLFVFPMIFLGGTFFAVDSMPVWLQYISKILPLTYFSDALRQVMTKGATFQNISTDLMIMLIWAVVLVFLAVYTFRFEDKK